jgi:hypothetical protein
LHYLTRAAEIVGRARRELKFGKSIMI